MKKLFAFGLLSSVLCLPSSLHAQAPQIINYQGRLLSGTNLVNGNVGLSLRLFDASTLGTMLYEDSNSVVVADGLYSTFIGDNPTDAAFLSALANTNVWIEVAVNGVALSPRERLASVGYSLATRGILVNANNNIFVLNPAQNSVAGSAFLSTLGGGSGNSIQHSSAYSFLGGGQDNSIQASASRSFLGGGVDNSIQGAWAFLGGGVLNTNASAYGALAGGYGNRVEGTASTVPGGEGNSASSYSFAAGRRAKATNDGSFVWADSTDADFGTSSSNQFLIRASGGVGIGKSNPSAALDVSGGAAFSGRVGIGTTTPGQNLTVQTGTTDTNATAKFGLFANGGHLWVMQSVSGFDTNATVTAATPAGSLQFVDLTLTTNQTIMTLAPNGRVGIGITNPTNKLDVAGSVGGTVFNATSDRNAKQDFAPVDAAAILEKISALPVATWSFKTEPDVKHIGPMAQDFRAAFGLGPNDTSIATVDADGVALAAIQALKKENDELKKQNEQILERLRALEAK